MRNRQAAKNPSWFTRFVDSIIEPFSPKKAVERKAMRKALHEFSRYRGADIHRLRSDWILGQEDDKTPDQWTLQLLRERSRDLNRNDSLASGATDTLGINIVGSGLRPQSAIRADYLGISEDRAQKLARQAELVWDRWTPLADSANILHFNEIQFLTFRKIIEDGEVIVLPTWANEPWRPFGRAIELIEAHRLNDPSRPGVKAENGIETGKRGEPKKYWIQKPGLSSEYQGYKARDDKGRPNILHIFSMKRPGQMRGIPFFTPVITLFKDLADYLEAEVVAARVAACLAVFITKQDPLPYAVASATDTEDDGSRVQAIEPGMVNYLANGENIGVVDPKRPGDSFAPFVEGVMRLIGVSLGLPYELLVKDFSKTNYSSARAALLEGRRAFTGWRNWFSIRFCQPIWDLVLEEAYLRGLFDVPDFYKYRSEYTRCRWIGGGWGWVDPVKEVQASKYAIDFGLSTLAEEVAGQGRDWEEVLMQRKREQDKIEQLGLEIKDIVKGGTKDAGTKEE